MRRAMIVLVLGLVALAPATSARAGGLDLRFGGFFPSGKSDLFTDLADLYTRGASSSTVEPPGIDASAFDGFTGGIEYSRKLVKNVELGVHLDGYGKTIDTSYRRFVRTSGGPIQQSLKLEVVPLGVSLRIVPTSRRARLAPFVAVGADLVYYRYEEFGDFIDFFVDGRPIISDAFRADGWAGGFHAAGGLRLAISDDFAVVGEARYLWAKKHMGDDFSNNEIDLGGLSATVGVHLRF